MPFNTRLTLLLVLCLSAVHCQTVPTQATYSGERVDGLSFVAPPRPFPENPMPAIQEVNANWIAVIPFAYTRLGTPAVYYNRSGRQWWGERPEGCRETIRLAHESGLNVLFKPQVYVPRSWPGGLDFQTEQEWQQWEQEYEAYIMPMVKMAHEMSVKMFCIGTEFKISTRKRPDFWRKLIQKIRKQYDGQLTYAANWDEYTQVPFWSELDYIGIDAYFPLDDSATPKLRSLQRAWQQPLKQMNALADSVGKPYLFTEYGYLSVDSSAGRTWELETKVHERSINEVAQARALQALYSIFQGEPRWAGGFLWKWFPNMQGHEGYPKRDYTPQGKLAQETIKAWFAQ